jgi:Zn-dependent peptidase ImmA (M78 family)
MDTDKTLADWYAKGNHELEANAFAAELLMPSDKFISRVKGAELSLQLISDVAGYFGTSLTATFLKYKDLGDFPVSIVYSEDGVFRWKQESDDFPFKYIQHETKVSGSTVAGDFHNGRGVEDVPVEIDALDWFPDDFKLKAYGDANLWEQAIPVSSNGVISCLWVD